MARYPTNLKAWKTQVGEIFADNRFFNSSPSSHPNWKPLIQALMTSDKERFVELTGIFYSRLLQLNDSFTDISFSF